MIVELKTYRLIIAVGLFFVVSSVSSQTRIKAMFYNLLNYDNTNVSRAKTPFLKTVLDEVQPDLFMVCELKNDAASDYLFDNAVDTSNPDFEKAPFNYGQSPDGGLLQMVYYNGKKLILESNRIIPTNTRDINHYTFRLKTVNNTTNPIKLEVFVTHLKASTGSTNRARRFLSIENFEQALDDISEDSYVLFSGDFNFYTSNEEGFQKLIDPNNRIVMIDPIDRLADPFPNDPTVSDPFDFYASSSTYFWRNISFADIHTQSTRVSNSGLVDQSGSTGGLDDRFDFIMMSENFKESTDFYYVANSYKSIGNNGNCYNSFIADANCTGTYNQTLRTALMEFSDHLPVVMEIETPQNTLSSTTYQTISFQSQNYTQDFLSINLVDENIKSFKIYNQLGQLVQTIPVNAINKNQITLNVKHLSKGIYYLSSSKNSVPLKFIKL